MQLRLTQTEETPVNVITSSLQPTASDSSKLALQTETNPFVQNESEARQLLESSGRDLPLREYLLLSEYMFLYPALFAAIVYNFQQGHPPETLLSVGILGALQKINQITGKKSLDHEVEPFLESAPNYLEVFIDGIIDPNPRIGRIASTVLGKVIFEVSRSEFDRLSPIHKRTLYNWLLSGKARQATTRTLIINALAQIGDETAIAYLEMIARRFPFSPSQLKVRSAARTVLPILHDRLEREKEHAARLNSLGLEELEFCASSAEQLSLRTDTLLEEEHQMSPEMKALLEKRESKAQPCMRMGYLLANFLVVTPGTGFFALQSILNHGNYGISALLIAATVASTQLYRFVLSPKDSNWALNLAQSGDVKAVGPLAEFLEWPDDRIRNEARVALCDLLPKLKASDAGLLNDRQRAALNAQLKYANTQSISGSTLQKEILRALQQVGDSSSIPYVQRLAEAKPVLRTEKEVVKAAKECLEYLKVRAQQTDSHRMLLRPSSAADVGPESLLRPANHHETAPEELVRPSDPGDLL